MMSAKSNFSSGPLDHGDLSLVYDRRLDLKGKPQLNVFITGISCYSALPLDLSQARKETLELTQLTSCALTAYQLYKWLLSNQDKLLVPLATIRFLSSPSNDELVQEDMLGHLGAQASSNNFVTAIKNWQRDACEHPEGHTWFYFAGHGVRCNRDTVLLTEDFGVDSSRGMLSGEVLFEDIFYGMIPSETCQTQDLSRKQIYFVDTCRAAHRSLDAEEIKTRPVLCIPKKAVDVREVSPTFFSASLGYEAFAVPGESTFLGKALMQCLNDGAGDSKETGEATVWEMSGFDLTTGLDFYLQALAATHGVTSKLQTVNLKPMVFLNLKKPPNVNVDIRVAPSHASSKTQIRMYHRSDNSDFSEVAKIIPPLLPHPYRFLLPAGYYNIDACIIPPLSGLHDWATRHPLPIKAPHREVVCDVSQ